MRLCSLLTMFLMTVNICFESSLSAIRDEDKDINSSDSLSKRANESSIIMKAGQNDRTEPQGNVTNFEDKSKEARINLLSKAFQAIQTVFLPPWNPVKSFERLKSKQILKRNAYFSNWLNDLATFLKGNVDFDDGAFISLMDSRSRSSEDQVSLYAWLLEFPHVRDAAAKKMMELATSYINKRRVFKALAELDVRPDYLFIVMGLRNKLRPGGTQITDLPFQRWFEYIQTYRSLHVKGDKRSLSAAFDNEELLTFLAQEMELMIFDVRSSREESYIFNAHPQALQQVVTLFELFRLYPEVEGFADSMLRYMVLNSLTTRLVLDTWSQSQLIPISVFNILRLGEDFLRADYVFLFTVWLQHVKSYCKDPAHNGNNILYAHLLSPTTLDPAVKTFFQSSKFVWMLNDIKMLSVIGDAGNLLQILAIPWHVKEWLDARMTPIKVLTLLQRLSPVAFTIKETGGALTLTNKSRPLDVDIWEWLSFVVVYKQKHQGFTENDVYSLLRPTMSEEDLLKLFISAREVPNLKILANDILKNIFREVTPTNVNRL